MRERHKEKDKEKTGIHWESANKERAKERRDISKTRRGARQRPFTGDRDK